MASLLAGIPAGLGLPPGLAGDSVPGVPSAPVQIGTPKAHHRVAEAGSWQILLLMLVAVLVLGAAVLLVAVRQRTRVLKRRRVRRTSEAAVPFTALTPTVSPSSRTAPATGDDGRRAEPPGPERVT
jgi:hypothetical protein